jgi:hypothetical protein
MFNRMLVTLGVFLGLNGAVAAQTATPQAPPPADAQTCALPSVVDTVELTGVPGSDLVTMPVEINGTPKQFLLAIGTNASEVSEATVDELHLTEGLKRTESFQAGPADQSDGSSHRIATVGATVQATLVDVKGANPENGRAHVNIPSFTLGTATGHNLQFAVASDREIGKSTPYDGLMTGSFFKKYDVELDFAAMKLNYLTPNTCADPHQVVFWKHTEVAVIPMNMVDGKIQVQVNVNGQMINAQLDTSSPKSIMRRDIAENTLNLKANTPQMPPVGDLRDGEDMQIYTATFPKITFAGGVTAYNVPALIQSNGMIHQQKEHTLDSRAQFKNAPRIPALTLGMDVLRQLHLYVVYDQGNIYMTSAE